MVELSEDRITTSVGPGNNWHDVYRQLDPKNVSVVGGREAGVGVGGLTLGGESDILLVPRFITNINVGGISYFSGRYGWACDNVRNYEVFQLHGKESKATHRWTGCTC
jgi:hypothetical protein